MVSLRVRHAQRYEKPPLLLISNYHQTSPVNHQARGRFRTLRSRSPLPRQKIKTRGAISVFLLDLLSRRKLPHEGSRPKLPRRGAFPIYLSHQRHKKANNTRCREVHVVVVQPSRTLFRCCFYSCHSLPTKRNHHHHFSPPINTEHIYIVQRAPERTYARTHPFHVRMYAPYIIAPLYSFSSLKPFCFSSIE